jgi:hypothetical protein
MRGCDWLVTLAVAVQRDRDGGSGGSLTCPGPVGARVADQSVERGYPVGRGRRPMRELMTMTSSWL